MASSSDCLLARAIPMPAKSKANNNNQVDKLAAQFDTMVTLEKKVEKAEVTGETKEQRRKRMEESISPADHLAFQSLRSSAMARKTNTTAKFSRDCRNLFADLLNLEDGNGNGNGMKKANGTAAEMNKSEEVEKEVKANGEEAKEEKDKKGEEEGNLKKKEGEGEGANCELIARGPIRANFIGHVSQSFHPYSALSHIPAANASPPPLPFNAAAPQSAVLDPSSLNPAAPNGYGYECGLPNNWNSSTTWTTGLGNRGGSVNGRDSVLSSASSTPDSTGSDMAQMLMSPGGQSERSELPDDLSDFILEYSRRYSPILSRKVSYSEGGSPQSMASADSPYNGCGGGGDDSPMTRRYHPASPRGTAALNGSKSPPTSAMLPIFMTKQGSTELLGARPAKERLRALIRSEQMDDALAWTCKCIQRHPGALTFQDADRDTLLHIVTSHLDLAKIYALVEQMLKMEVKPGETAPFDLPNGMGETPLMLAVQKRQKEMVDYLLEAGAVPNVQSSRLERDTPLHYAATRGMASIARSFCADPRTNLNAQNGMGLTPLLCAFKNHGIMEEESQSQVCNLEVAEVLLKRGANPMLADSANGRTLVHYAVERMDERLIELLRSHLDEKQLGQLVNQADYSGETPMRALEGMLELKQERKAQICLALITCGADASGHNTDEDEEAEDEVSGK